MSLIAPDAGYSGRGGSGRGRSGRGGSRGSNHGPNSNHGQKREPARARPHAWQIYLALGAVGAVLYELVPPFKGYAPLLNLMGVSAVVAVVVGVRRNRPRYALPWWLFAVGL